MSDNSGRIQLAGRRARRRLSLTGADVWAADPNGRASSRDIHRDYPLTRH